jgi:VanZ family protein
VDGGTGRSGARGWRLLFGLAIAAQLVALYAPRAPGEGGIPHVDKLVHAAIFGAVALTAAAVGLPLRWVVPVLLVHAGLSEVVQGTLLPHRDGDWHDALADAVGTLLGAVAALHWRPGRMTPRVERSTAGESTMTP